VAPNIFSPCFDEDVAGRFRRARLGRQVGAARLGLSLYELSAGWKRGAYHCHYGNEELLIVLSGRPSLRTPEGWRELEEGEMVHFPVGEAGAHKVVNRSAEPVRYLMLSEMNAPDVVLYPDSKKVLAISRPPGSEGDEEELAYWFRVEDAVDYWDGEPADGEDESN
jgi:uncharacterized cupin superfamily protein